MSIMRCIVLAMAGAVMTAATVSAQDAPVASAAPQAGDGDPTLLLNRAVMLYGDRNFDECERALSRLLELEPGNGLGRFLRALCYGQQAFPHQEAAGTFAQNNQPDQQRAEERSAADLYGKMQKDLDVLIQQGLPNREAIVLLLDAVAAVKIVGLSDPAATPSRSLLDDARQSLEKYLEKVGEQGQLSVTGLNRVRGRFFLGVVLYRQATPPAEPGKEKQVDYARLKQARDVLAVMVDPDSQEYVSTVLAGASDVEKAAGPAWMSYAEFYLGLVAVFEAGQEKEYQKARELLVSADAHLDKAREFNTDKETQQPRSRLIQERAEGLSKDIQDELAKAPAAGTGVPIEDLRIDLQMGLVYDTNVVLLGDTTLSPRGVGHPSDGRFESALGLTYTLDLAKIDNSLKGWTVAMSGRASSSWHFDISSYNEQDYGGSVAIQRELIEPWTSGEHQQGPLYFAIQYDYDYFLLGNNGFLSNNRVTPRFALFSFDQRALSTLGFRYENRDYFEDLIDKRFNRDGNYFAFFVNQSYDWIDSTALFRQWGWEPWGLANDPKPGDPAEQRYLRPFVGAEYGWDSTVGNEYDNKYMLLAGGVEVPLPYGVMFDFRGEWEWDNYGGTRGGSLVDYHRRGRDDFVQRYRFGLERRFVLVPGIPDNRNTIKVDRLVMTLRGDIAFTDDDSNVQDRARQAVYSYDRALYGVSVQFSFN